MRLISHSLLAAAPVMPCFPNSGLVTLVGDQAFFYMCSRGGEAAINTTARTRHIMGRQQSCLELRKRDVWVLADQLQEERQKRFQFATAFARS